MTSLPHPLPSRTAQNIAALYGHEDDTLIAWQRFCAQVAEALRAQHDHERLARALALAQNGDVVLEDDGTATVTSGAKHYTVADGACDCPDAQHRGAPCKHGLAVAIHQQAMALLTPSASAALQPAATIPPPPALAPKTRPVRPPSADRWDVTEAPASCCLRLRVGALELMYTMRDVSDAELTGRVQHLVPWVQDLLDQARERHAQLAAVRQQRAAATVAPAAPLQPPAAPAALPQPDLPALLQQLQHVLTASTHGHAASSPSPPAPSGPAPDDQQTGFCSLHQVQMERKHNDRGTFYGHWLAAEQRHCNGRRNGRR